MSTNINESSTTKIKVTLDDVLVKVISYVVIGIFAILCAFPFLLMITSSFMSEKEIIADGFKLFPKTLTISAYKFLLDNPIKVFNAYKITILITAIGTILGLFFMSMAGFVLNRKDFKYRNSFSFFFYFTTLFSGGLIPTYILMVSHLHLKDNIWSMILPGIMSAWSIFLMKNFMKSIPDSLFESAALDGAGDFRIYWQITMPLAVPSLATIGLFLAISFWNEWYNGMLYMDTIEKYPLQLFLQKMINQTNVQTLVRQGVQVDASDLPTQSIKMATSVLATGPVILMYPFAQKYFIGGLTVGAVKG